MIYDKIYDFCKVRNRGNCFVNGEEPTPRVKFIMELLKSEGIAFELDVFEEERREPPQYRQFSRGQMPNRFDDFDDEEIIEPVKRKDKKQPSMPKFDEDDYDEETIKSYKGRIKTMTEYLKHLNSKDNKKIIDITQHKIKTLTEFLNGIEEIKKQHTKNENRFFVGGDRDNWRNMMRGDADRGHQSFRDREPERPRINKYFNIIMKGTSDKMVIAHHDVNNPTIDNANDNSASVINVIATKKLRPDINAVIVDGEEFGGIGSSHLGEQIKKGKFGNIKWVLNYELTGKGGKYFFIGNFPGKLSDHIVSLFDCPIVDVPFNDSITLRRHGIDSTVINPIPPTINNKKSDVLFPDGTYLDKSILHNCHSSRDSIQSISPKDMKEFVEEVILKILE